MIIAETPRLTLRQLRPSDVNAMCLLFGDAAVMRYGDGVRSAPWVRSWLADSIDNHYPHWGFGMWAVVQRSTSIVIGYCGLSRFPERCGAHEAELGFRLTPAHWGRGLATEATMAARDYAFGALLLPRLIAMVDPGNVASVGVVRKLGMKYEREVMLEGYDHPDHLYALGAPANP